MDIGIAWTKTEERIIEKLNSLNNVNTFWDDVRKITKNIHSDRVISSWEWLSEKRYNEIRGIEEE